MRNLKVGSKLVLIMMVTLVLFAVTIVIAAVSMNNTNKQLDKFYTSPYQVRAAARDLDSAIEGMVKSVFRIAATSSDTVRKSAQADIDVYLERIDGSIAVIDQRYLGDRETVDDLTAELELLRGDREKSLEMAYSGAPASQVSQYIETNNLVHIRIIKGYVAELIAFSNNKGETMLGDIRQSQQDTVVTMIAIALAGILLSLILALVVARSMTLPLARMRDMMNRTGTTGDIYFSEEEEKNLAQDMTGKDEIGQTIHAFKQLTDHITTMSEALELVAQKDLSGEVMTLSDKDVLGNAIEEMQNSLNKLFSEMQWATAQVSIGSGQIADGSQTLAQGVTEQSVVIEQLAAAMVEISKQTDNNMNMAVRAKEMGTGISKDAQAGSIQMKQMLGAMNEINSANQSIGRVIGLIEDIAFQTNILSLNAAIEAARAGEHGRGFGVIVTAVRELAAKSAEAADTINQLVASSTEKSEIGSTISVKTAKAIDEILSRTQINVELVSQIAQASTEQSIAISQVVTGIEQVAEVVQRNSITAEQSATASEEMSRQADQLREFLAQFKIRKEA